MNSNQKVYLADRSFSWSDPFVFLIKKQMGRSS